MMLPEKNAPQAVGTTELVTFLDEATRMTAKASEILQGDDYSTVEGLMRRRGSVIEKAAALCCQKPMNGRLSAGQKEVDAHLRTAAAVLQKSDEELRSLLRKKKAAVLDQIEIIEKQKQIRRYTHTGEIPEETTRRTHA